MRRRSCTASFTSLPTRTAVWKETIAVAVTPHKDRSSGGGRLSTRLLLERGMCRASWLERTFPQLSRQSDCLLVSMVPYVDDMFGVEV